MKCQHCGSDDIVAIQGQNYCLNCGYAVTAPAAAPASPAASASSLPAIPSAVSVKAEEPPKPAKLPAAKPKRKTSKAITSVKAAPAVQTATVKASNDEVDIIPSTPSRRIHEPKQDIRPTVRNGAAPVAHPLRFSLGVSAVAAVVCGVVTAATLWFHLDADSAMYVIAATIVSLGICVGLAHAALLYGRSRSQDGRPAPRSYWWIAARGGFMDVLNVQLIGIIGALVVVGCGVVVWRTLAVDSLNLGTPATLAIVGIINLLLVWLLLGLYATARMATPAVVIGGYSAPEAVRVGWWLYLKAGGHLVGAALEALLSRAVVAVILVVAAYAAAKTVTTTNTTVISLGTGGGMALVVFCAVMLSLEVDTKLWLTQYRHWVTLCPPAERIRLLTGRVQSHH